YAAAGLCYYKLKVHHPGPRENRRRAAAGRRALGEGVGLMGDVPQTLGVLGHMPLAAAVRAVALARHGDPLLRGATAQCAEVARAGASAVPTAENHYPRVASGELRERRAARGLRPDIRRANRFTATTTIMSPTSSPLPSTPVPMFHVPARPLSR